MVNTYKQLISCWHKMEHFTPTIIPKNEVKILDKEQLPWLPSQKPSQPNKRVIHLIYLGVFTSSHVIDFVKNFFKDNTEELNPSSTSICFASLKLDEAGLYINDTLGVSTLPWALGQLEKGEIANDDWSKEFKKTGDDIALAISGFIKGKQTYESLLDIQSEIMKLSGWSVTPPVYMFYKTEEVFCKERKTGEAKDDDNVKTDLLNSFFIKDLERIICDYEETKELPSSFETYVKANVNEEFPKKDLKNHTEVLKEMLSPLYYPDGRWPSKFKASLMQQFAVNIACNKLSCKMGGLFSVNGPPGTGKTTLLRDVIAAILVERAAKLITYANPLDAFSAAGRLQVKSDYIPAVYAPAPELCEGGIVVASSNNGAVENISKELPLKKEAEPYGEVIGYFREVSESCIGSDNWGLISAVLGNKDNCKKLGDTIWYKPCKVPANKETLKEAIKKDTYTLQEWDLIVKEHQELIKQVRKEKRILETYRLNYEALRKKASELTEKKILLSSQESILDSTEQLFRQKERRHKKESDKKHSIKKDLDILTRTKPGWITFIFNHKKWKAYRLDEEALRSEFLGALRIVKKTQEELEQIQILFEKEQSKAQWLRNECSFIENDVISLEERIHEAKSILGECYADNTYWEEINSHRIQETSPWCSDALKELQIKVFLSALKVNEAFIVLAGRKVNTTIDAFFNYLNSTDCNLDHTIVKAMWDTFFMVIPVVSTTFSSIERMFKHLRPQDIPWLFIDEAGQAAPQAAAGAIWRSKRVIVVGDPFQIEPVVTIPNLIVDNISGYYGFDKQHIHSFLSTQTMADRCNPYGWYNADTWIGSPLRVHRRCVEPMFTISNDIAYNGFMFNSTMNPIEKLHTQFQTKFISCTGAVVPGCRHYVHEQFVEIQDILINEININEDLPDIFIISPFNEVAYKLRQNLYSPIKRALGNKKQKKDGSLSEWFKKHIGTVHTFQGRQAEGVILCLGLDNKSKGAASWAASKPNLLNVAVTRAKYRFIAIGDENIWLTQKYFEKLSMLNEK